jgi:flagellar basal body rod protein FlgG
MKNKYILSFLLAAVFMTVCQKNLSVSAPAPDFLEQNIIQRMIVQSLKEDLKEQQQLQAEIAKLLKEIRDSESAQRKLFAWMAKKLDKADVLVATGKAIDIAIDRTLHNIANWKTTGFKKQRVHIQDGKIVDTYRVWTMGDFSLTGNPLDIVIQGQGFFQIRQSSGEIAYTRNGNFHLNRDGDIVSSEGNPLYPKISIPQDQIGINLGSDGTVSIMKLGESQLQKVGHIELARFQNPSGLEAVGPTFLGETPASGPPDVGWPGDNGAGTILSGYLEDSNVNLSEELMQLRTLQSWEKVVDQALMTIQEGQK